VNRVESSLHKEESTEEFQATEAKPSKQSPDEGLRGLSFIGRNLDIETLSGSLVLEGRRKLEWKEIMGKRARRFMKKKEK
jgi:hypothetical protein